MRISSHQLTELHHVQLSMLLDIQNVCRANEIDFFLDSGTMLGAARHAGFIPWDDDVDIAMPRTSYDRFLRIAQRELGPKYFLQSNDTDASAPFSFAKVRLNGTEMVELLCEDMLMHQGIWIDIFPFDIIDNSPQNVRKKRAAWRFWQRILKIRETEKALPDASALKRVAKKMLHAMLLPISIKWLIKRLDGLADRDVDNDRALYVCFHYPTKFVTMSENDLYPLTSLEFEGRSFPVPNHWERYLERTYNNWQELPPVEARNSHELASFVLPNDQTSVTV